MILLNNNRYNIGIRMHNEICNLIKGICSGICNGAYFISIELFIYIKYFLYFNFFLMILFFNFSYYKITDDYNECLVNVLHYCVNLNGAVLIKFIQWIVSRYSLLKYEGVDGSGRVDGSGEVDGLNSRGDFLVKLFSNFYENCNIHSFSYTKKVFRNEFLEDFDEIIEINRDYSIKSGSIAQVYKGALKSDPEKEIAIKVVHPEIKYQMLFPIAFIKVYKYIVENIGCLYKYNPPFNIGSFLDSLKIQVDMLNEFNNMKYFYNEYEKNEYIVIPKPVFSSQNILIMEFVSGQYFEEVDMSEFNKYKVIMLFMLFMKDTCMFKDYYHGDLHDGNWKIRPYKDFYQLVIYDFGLVMRNNDKLLYKNISYATDIDDNNMIARIFFSYIKNDIEENEFVDNYVSYMEKMNVNSLNVNNILYSLNYLTMNKYAFKNDMLEILLSLLFTLKYLKKYIDLRLKKINGNGINIIIERNFAYMNLCKKLDIFHDTIGYIEEYYINNDALMSNYKYNNDYLKNIGVGADNDKAIVNSVVADIINRVVGNGDDGDDFSDGSNDVIINVDI